MITGTDFLVMHTKDFDTAVEFYGTTLGLPESARYGKMPGVEFETGNLTIAVMQSDAFGMEYQPTTNRSRYALTTCTPPGRARGQGRAVRAGDDRLGVCHMAFFRDPDGNALMLHHRYAPRD